MVVKDVAITDLKAYENNPRINDAAVDAVAASIKNFGFKVPIIVDKNNVIVAGHTRLRASKKLGLEKVPVIVADDLTEEQIKAFRLADNKTAELAEWDFDKLETELAELQDVDFDMTQFGFEDLEQENIKTDNDRIVPLSEKFLVPPFSVLDAKQGYWADRKKMWKKFGIKSEIGRGNNGDKTQSGLVFVLSAQPVSVYKEKEKYQKQVGKTVTWEEFAELFPDKIKQPGTSIFDPVLCEIMYKWFCVDAGKILDPFAGGSVRGIVAKECGYKYYGNDLRKEQIEANIENATEIFGNIDNIHWSVGDSCKIDDIIQERNFDLVFTCPPYADLEVYSDDKADISNMDYPNFLKAYETILTKSINMLAPDRFCIVVVGDVRDKQGLYRNFIGDTKNICIKNGANLYNEFILLEQIGSAAMRAANQFNRSRKNCKIHQNVLVFYKGDPKNISKNFLPLDFSGIEEFDIEEDLND